MMSFLLPPLVAVGLAAATQANGQSEDMMQKRLDPSEATLSEYARLKAKGTREALELFIERHPDDPLADKAREEIDLLYGNEGRK